MTDRCPTDVYYEFHGMEQRNYNPIEIARQYAPKFDKPVVDMVEVVRCKDCKHRPVPNGNNHPLTPKPSEFEWDETCPYVCTDEWHNEMPEDNDFCSKAERREDADSDTDTDDF